MQRPNIPAFGVGFVSMILMVSLPIVRSDSTWQLQDSGVKESLRGLHVISDSVVWASGTGGTVLRTLDGGESWSAFKVKGAEELDFRDIHAFDERVAIVTSAGSPARIYRTVNGGVSWSLVFEHKSNKAFFDAMSFWSQKNGLVMSDPVDDRLLLIQSEDGGKTWAELDRAARPTVVPGEAGFAASGTNMVVRRDGTWLIALGSAKEGEQFNKSRIAISKDQGKSWTFAEVPMSRNPSSGIFSMAFLNDLIGVAVGGDYLKPEKVVGNVAYTNDGGMTWKVPSGNPPSGYRSGVAANRSGKLVYYVTVGPSGTDWSVNNPYNWKKISDEGFHAIQFSPTGNTGWASGGDGRIGKWIKRTDKNFSK